jgi:hypothetical protein
MEASFTKENPSDETLEKYNKAKEELKTFTGVGIFGYSTGLIFNT